MLFHCINEQCHIFRNWLTEMYLTEMYLYRVKLWSSTSELYCTYSYITKFLSKTKFFIKTLCTFLQRIFSAWLWNVTWQKCLCSKMISDRPPQIVKCVVMHHWCLLSFFLLCLLQARDLRSLKIISNPAHPAARNILSERYGIALPYIVDKHEQPAQVC